MFVNMLFKVT